MTDKLTEIPSLTTPIFSQNGNGVSLEEVLKLAVDGNASDLHFKVGSPPELRKGTKLVPMDNYTPLDHAAMEILLEVILSEKQRKRFSEVGELDKSLQTTAARFRVNAGMERSGPYITIRVIPYDIRQVLSLGFPTPVWREIISLNHGLVLVTGVTGSGKSTTLASLIQEINSTQQKKVICIEDPIEAVYKKGKSMIIQLEVGVHTTSFYSGVMHALRQDPDILLIGEIRDQDTAQAALQAAETGHLVFSTLHTKDAAGTIGRYVDLFPEERKGDIRSALADNLAYVLCQDLVPYQRVDRVLAMEIMKNTPAISNLIREGKPEQIPTSIQTSREEGMITMDQCLIHLHAAGKVSLDVALHYARRKEYVRKELNITKK